MVVSWEIYDTEMSAHGGGLGGGRSIATDSGRHKRTTIRSICRAALQRSLCGILACDRIIVVAYWLGDADFVVGTAAKTQAKDCAHRILEDTLASILFAGFVFQPIPQCVIKTS